MPDLELGVVALVPGGDRVVNHRSPMISSPTCPGSSSSSSGSAVMKADWSVVASVPRSMGTTVDPFVIQRVLPVKGSNVVMVEPPTVVGTVVADDPESGVVSESDRFSQRVLPVNIPELVEATGCTVVSDEPGSGVDPESGVVPVSDWLIGRVLLVIMVPSLAVGTVTVDEPMPEVEPDSTDGVVPASG